MLHDIIQGDSLSVLRGIASDTFDCVVTSPPYWGLRDYGVPGQIGQEATLREYIDAISEVCMEVRRVLKPQGTFFLNVGDAYARQGGSTDTTALTRSRELAHMHGAQRRMMRLSDGFKDKDLMMIPNRLAIRLQDDGWWVRSEIIWNKPNAMPYSGTDRPASAHEKIWLLTKSKRYFWDKNAVREPSGATLRNVWTIPVKAYPGEHEAIFPPALVERCLLAGCPHGGTVLDPFGGHGTTAVVAAQVGRRATIIELNPKYADAARARLAASEMRDGGAW